MQELDPAATAWLLASTALVLLMTPGLAIFYGGMVCIAGVLGNKQVALGPLAVEAGIFAFLKLPVAPLPQVDFPVILVQAQMAGAA